MLIRNPTSGSAHNAELIREIYCDDDHLDIRMNLYDISGFGPIVVIQTVSQMFTTYTWNQPQPLTAADIPLYVWYDTGTAQMAMIRNGWPVSNMESEKVGVYPNGITRDVFLRIYEDYLQDDVLLGEIREKRDGYAAANYELYLNELAQEIMIMFAESAETWAEYGSFTNMVVNQALRQVDWTFIARYADSHLDSLIESLSD